MIRSPLTPEGGIDYAMKKIISCFLLFVLFSLPFGKGWGWATCFAQYNQTIRGQVIDKDSKSALEGASVSILNSSIGFVTDSAGNFRLNDVPVGRQTIQVSYVGYEDASLENIVVTTGKEIVLTIELTENVSVMKGVTVSADEDKTKTVNALITNSGNSFSNEQTGRYAGSRQDPSRMVANYAGVSGQDDQRNDVIVRGNSPLGVLWRVDGVDIPSPNHFSGQGASGGALSMLNNFLLDRSDFLTGAFPAEYGNKMSAAFDLKLRNGNNEKFETAIQLGINGAELTAEGPFSKKHKSSFLLSYRYSTFAIFKLLGISFGVSGIPTYQDATIKLNFPLGKKNNLSFFAIGGISKMSILDSEKDTSNWTFTKAGEDVVYGYDMGVAGITHTFFVNNNTYFKNIFSVNANLISIKVDSVSKYTTEKWKRFINNSTERNFSLTNLFNKKFNSHHLLKIGLTNSLLSFNYLENYYSFYYGKYLDLINAKGNNLLTQSFAEWQWRVNQRLTLNSGIHFQYFFLNKKNSLEPRFGISYLLNEKQSISLAYGLMSQMQPLVIYFEKKYLPATNDYVQTNKNLDFSKAHHIVLGTDWKPQKNFHVKAETFYQWLFNIPVKENIPNAFSLINLGGDFSFPIVDSLKNTGTGTNYGVELTLEKFFTHHYYFLITSSIFSSKYKGSDGVERHTKFGGGYMLTTLGGFEIPFGRKAKNFLSLDGRFSWVAGNYYTPIDLPESILSHHGVENDAQTFSAQNPDYMRADLKLGYTINYKKVNQSISIVVENIFNHKNILDHIYDDANQSINNEYQLGLFPYGAYRIEF